MDSRIHEYSCYFNTDTKRIYKASKERQNEYKASIPKDKQIPLDYGFPNSVQFPVLTASFTTRDGDELKVSPEEMENCLQYGGNPDLKTWLKDLYKRVHNPPTMDDKNLPSSLALQVTSGGREGVSKILGMLLEDGDSLLGEEFTYHTLVTMIVPRGIKGVSIKSNADGLDAHHLTQVMSDWDETTQGRRPRLLYVVPSCSNPTGSSWSIKGRQLVYEAARRFDLLILEDDPYYHLQFQRPLLPSLLSMDTDGRVLRADSFSKTLSPGCRVGFLFGPSQIVGKLQSLVFADTGGCSKLSQMLIYKVVEHMGYEKFIQHTDNMAKFYKGRCDKMIAIMENNLRGLCEWTAPSGGMFVWIKVLGMDDCEELNDILSRRGAFFVKGSVFTIEKTSSPHLRVSFSLGTDEDFEKGISILAESIKDMTQG